MNTRHAIITALGFSLMASTMVACGPSDEGEAIDHATTQQNLETNTKLLIDGTMQTMKFMESSDMIQEGWGNAGVGSTTCTSTGDGNEICETSELEIDAGDGAEELNTVLKTYIFAESNIETQTETEITYRLKPATVCKDAEGDSKNECVDFFTKVPIRINVTSPSPKALRLKLLVGANKLQPISIGLAPTSLSATVDLGDAKASAEQITAALGQEMPEMPASISGVLTAGLDYTKTGKGSLTTYARVDSKVQIADSALGFDISLDKGQLVKTIIDGNAETVNVSTDMGAFNAIFPIFSNEEGVSITDEGSSKKHKVDAHLGGLNANLLLDVKNEVVSLTGLGLGDSTSTLKIDGTQIFGIDLNKDANRRVDLNFKQSGDDFEIEIAPSLQLTAAYALGKLQAIIPSVEVEEWMKDDVLTISASGATPVKMLTGDGIDGLKMLAGKLTIKAENADISHTVETNMCLSGEGAETSVDGDENPTEAPEHPFAQLNVNSCQ